MRTLDQTEIESVSGGDIVVIGNDTSWADELLKYKTGQPNLIGINPDGSMPEPPFGA